MSELTSARDGARRTICYCFDISDEDIRAHMSQPGCSVDTLVDATGIGTKCTACRLDLDVLVGSAIGHEGQDVLARGVTDLADQPGFSLSSDNANCGFFVQNDTIASVLRVENHGQFFDMRSPLARYRYLFTVVDAQGRVRHRRKGRLAAHDGLEIRFAEIPDCPAFGWFSIGLYAESEGLAGCIRPQVAFLGAHWSATYHAQLLSMASRRRTILLRSGLALDAAVPIVNVDRRPARIELQLNDIDGAYAQTAQLEIPPYGAVMADLDALFQQPPADALCVVGVTSDRPVRHYIVIRHRDGSWCVDHFPTTK